MKLLCATFAVLTAASAHAQSLAPDVLFARVAPNVWVVQTGDAQGKPLATGNAVALGPGKAVTSCRLLAKASTVVLRRENVSYGATLEFPDPERDLCQLRIANFDAPVIPLTPLDGLRVGMPLYTVGSPDGADQALGVGMLAALRRGSGGQLEALQLAAAPDNGLGGAGLFDAQGRLAGLVSAPAGRALSAGSAGSAATPDPAARLALPATWIAELPGRGRQAIEGLRATPRPAGVAASRFSVVEYVLRDKLTKLQRKVLYRVDPEQGSGSNISFNEGTWVEKPGGGIVSAESAIAGEFDSAMPPGGWVRLPLTARSAWSTAYTLKSHGGLTTTMDLQATAAGESVMPVEGRNMKVMRIDYQGYTQRSSGSSALVGNQNGPYRATVWYAPDLGRVVRFEAQTRGGSGAAAFQVDEELELVGIR